MVVDAGPTAIRIKVIEETTPPNIPWLLIGGTALAITGIAVVASRRKKTDKT